MTTSPIRCPAFKSSVHRTDAWAFHDHDRPLKILLDNVPRAYRVVRDSDNIDVKLLEDLGTETSAATRPQRRE